VNRLPARRERGFLHRLGQRWVPVARPRDVLRARAVLHREHALREELPRGRTDDVRAEDLRVEGPFKATSGRS